MPVERALGSFRGVKGYNCAQAVLAAFEETHAVSADRISALRGASGGRADSEGTCGALYAACQLLSEEKQQVLRELFVNAAGSTTCREIRKLGKWDCRECVAQAAAFVAECTDESDR